MRAAMSLTDRVDCGKNVQRCTGLMEPIESTDNVV